MANNQYINKVVYGNQVLLDLTSDTIEADKILKGYTAHKANGEPIVGTYEGGGEGYTINLTASSSELYGQSIVVSYEGQRVTTIQFSNAGTASIVVQEEGVYNFAVSYGGLTYYCDVNVVSAIVTYNETIYYYPNGSTVTPVNDVQIWISCADVRDKNYTTLAEVLDDVQLLATLMASENAVNYLVRSKQFIKSEALVPVMTSNTTPSGECFGSSYYSDPYNRYNYYRTFDGIVSSSDEGWNNSETSPTDYIGYDFTENVIVKKVEVALRLAKFPQRNVTLRGSHDKVTWDNISVLAANITDTAIHTYNVANTTAYRYYSIQSTAGSGNSVTFSYIQFYSEEGVTENQTAMSYIGANDYASDTLLSDSTWRDAINGSTYSSYVENASVPTMTSYNTPSGVCSASSIYTGYYPYYAFDGNSGSLWHGTAIPAWVMYEFETPMMAVKCLFNPQYNNSNQYVKDYKIQGSNDNVTWDDLYSETLPNADVNKTFSLSNTTTYKYYRMYATSSYSGNAAVKTLQFYGRQNGGVQTWLHTAGITDKTYTTLSEVFADSATLSTLMANHDAVDYLVTCKGWATEVCSNQSAMSYIGLNNYCANTLLADVTWNEAICNSTYFESVLNAKVPTMTSYTTPEGVVSASSENSAGRPAWWAFDNTMSNNWVTQNNVTTNQWIRYKFTTELSVNKVEIYSTNRVKNFIVQCSNDNFVNDSHDIYSGVCANNTVVTKNTFNFVGTSDRYMYWQVLIQDMYSSAQYPNISIEELQFYGRKDV